MSIYNLTTDERRMRAQKAKQLRENRYLYQKYIRSNNKSSAQKAEDLGAPLVDESNERKNQNVLIRTLSTIGDMASNVVTGLGKGLEGILDMGAGIVGGVGGLFSEDFKNDVKDFVARDWVGEYVGDPLQELTKYSYTNDGEIGRVIEGAFQGVGQMLPAVAVSLATGASAAVAQRAALATMGVSAAGSSTEEAFNDDADYWRGLGYGVASGAVEMGTEKFSGGFGKLFGAGALDNLTKNIAKTGIKRVAKEAIGEGVEEVAAELFNPLLKGIYKGSEAFKEYGEGEYWKGVGEAGATGALTSVLYGETVGRATKTTGPYGDVNNTLAQIKALKDERNKQFSDGTLTTDNDSVIDESITENYKTIEKVLKKASQTTRDNIIKRFDIGEYFGQDGTFKGDNSLVGVQEAQALNKEYYSPSLRGKETEITEALAKQGASVYKGAFTQEEKTRYSEFKKTIYALGKRGLISPDFVVSETSPNYHSYIDRKTIVMGKDAFESDIWQDKLIHEVEHFTEGSKEWGELASFVFNETNVSESIERVSRNYGISEDVINTTFESMREGKKLTAEQQRFVSEVVAHQSEALFGNEQMLTKLAKGNKTLLQKLIDRIKQFIDVIRAKTPEERSLTKKLQQAQRLFEKALDNAGVEYIKSTLNTSENVDTGIQFSKKIEEYPYDMQTVIKEYLDSVDETILEIATEHRNNKNTRFVRQKICDVDADFQQKIKDMFDMDIGGFTFNINSNTFNHIEKRHGIKGEADKTMANLKDLARVGYVIENRDTIEPILKNGEQVYSKEFRTEDGILAPLILIKKKINGTYYCAIAVTDGKYKKVWVQTAFINKRDGLTQILHDEISSLSFTSETVAASHPSTDIISAKKEKINTFDKKDVKYSLKDTQKEALESRGVKGDAYLDCEDLANEILAVGGEITNDAKAVLYHATSAENAKKIIESGKMYGKEDNLFFSTRSDGEIKGYGNAIVRAEIPLEKLQLNDVFDKEVHLTMSVRPNTLTNIRFSLKDQYSYDALIKKPDLNVVTLSDDIPRKENGQIDRNAVIAQGRENARKQKNSNNTETDTYVRVDDIEQDVLLGAKGMQHGLVRSEETALAVMKVGDVLKNSVAVNEMNGSDTRKTDMSYVLLSACQDNESLYVVRSVVSKLQNDVTEIDVYKLGAVKGKKTETPNSALKRGAAVTEQSSLISSGSPVISIADLLENVKDQNLANEVFSKDVAERLGVERSKGTLSNDLKYSLKETSSSNKTQHRDIIARASKLEKYIADNTKLKKYSRQDAKDVISSVMTNEKYFDGYDVTLRGKSRAQIERILWNGLNGRDPGERASVALDIADYILKDSIVTEATEPTADVDYANSLINTLKQFLHRMNLGAIKGDIEAKFDKDKSPYLLWANKTDARDRGYTADEVKQELEANGFRIDATNEADIFLEIDKLYREARAIIKESIPEKSTLIGVLGADEAKRLKQRIANDILNAYDEYGSETRFAKVHQRYRDQISVLKEKVYDAKKLNDIENAVLKEVQEIRDSKSGKYANATQVQSKMLDKFKSLLSRINSREHINRTSTREIMAQLAEWYVNPNEDGDKANKMLAGFYSKDVAELARYFASDDVKGPLTYNELRLIQVVLHHMNHIFKNHNKIYKNGKYVDAIEIAKAQNKSLAQANKSQTGLSKVLISNPVTRFFMDPMSVMQNLDAYDEKGFFTTTYDSYAKALIEQKHNEMRILTEYDKFEREHKNYMKQLRSGKATIEVGAFKIPKYAALELYMVSKTGEAMATLEETGFLLQLDGAQQAEKMGTLTKRDMEYMYHLFSEEDKALIKIMEHSYNHECRELKYDTDMKRIAFSNVFDGYYHPVPRITATNVDTNDIFTEMERVSNSFFNKNRVKGAREALIIGNALTMYKAHINAVTRYASLSIPIENMQRLYNLDVSDNANMPESIKMSTSKEINDYITKFTSDLQNVRVKPDGGERVVSYMRGAYAKFQLGFNPKVWFTQLSSYIAASSELSYKSLTRALRVKGNEVDKYCPLAAVRHYDMGATKAMTVTDKVGTVGQIATKPIETVDRMVIKKLFGACQAEIKSKHGLEIGTEENKTKAGELLTELILKTQQNQLVTEQSGAMRSTSELVRSLTMFNSDSMKMLSRFLDSVGKTSVLSKKLKNAKISNDTESSSAIKLELKKAKKTLIKRTTAIVSMAIYMALLAKAFKLLYNKDDEDESVWQWLGEESIGNIVGMVPIIRDVYSYFYDGYEIENFTFSMVNDVLSSVNNLKSAFVDMATGKEVTNQEHARNIRNMFYSVGQLLGIPTRNVYNFATGIIRRVDESTGLRIDSAFTSQSESYLNEELEKALREGNSRLANSALEIICDKRGMAMADSSLKDEFLRLIRKDSSKSSDDENNYNPLPGKIPNYVTVNEEQRELSANEKNSVAEAYAQAGKLSASIVKSTSYSKLDDSGKAYAIKKIYELYRKLAVSEITGESDKLTLFSKAIGADKLALILAYVASLKAGTGTRIKIEAFINAVGLSYAQRMIALAYFNYIDDRGQASAQNYIQRLDLNKYEKNALLKYVKIS